MENSLMLLNGKKDIKITNASLELLKLNIEHKAYEEKYKSRKKELEGIVKSAGYKEFAFETPDGNMKARCVESNKIIWDVDKIKENIKDERILNEILEKKYTISDFNGLVEYLDVDEGEFKSFLEIEEKVNEKSLDQLSQLGEVTDDMLDGCYKVQNISSYIKFTEIKPNEESEDAGDKNGGGVQP